MNLASRFVLPLVALVATTGLGRFQDTEPVVLRLKFKPGETLKFRSVNYETMKAGEESDDKVTTLTMGVTAGETKDGWTDVSLGFIELESTDPSTAEVFPLFLDVKVGMKVDGRGTVKELTGAATKAESEAVAEIVEVMFTGVMNGGFMGVRYPEKGVKAGDTWTATLDADEVMGGMLDIVTGGEATVKGKLDVKYEIKSFRTSNGTKLVEIAYTLSGTPTLDIGVASGTMVLKTVGTVLADVANGMLVRTRQSTTSSLDLGVVKIEDSSELFMWRS